MVSNPCALPARLILLIALLWSGRGCMCSPAESVQPAMSSITTTTTTTTTTTPVSTTSSTEDPCDTLAGCPPEPAPEPKPCPDWPGWETWDDFAASCPLCVPASQDALPPPIEWEPCDPTAEMAAGCRQMKVDWPWYSTPFAYAASVDVQLNGQAIVDIVRLSRGGPDEWRMKVVAAADGAVLSAMVDPRSKEAVNSSSCYFGFHTRNSASGGKVVFHVRDGGTDGDFPEAVVGGAAAELHPKVQWIWNHSAGPGIAASSELWVTWDSVRIGVARWGEPWEVVFHGSEAGGLQQTTVNPFGDWVTWESGNGIYLGLMAWTPEEGAYPFITYPGDFSRGAWGLGMDGSDLVWTYSEGKGPALELYPAGSVMTAPFTTDPAALEPRRLRSHPSPHYPMAAPWQVGCGHAAVVWDIEKVLIVRLSDGWSWTLTTPNPNAEPTEQWRYGMVYAVTCEEVFLRAGIGAAMNIARVRLDALGPGMAPD